MATVGRQSGKNISTINGPNGIITSLWTDTGCQFLDKRENRHDAEADYIE